MSHLKTLLVAAVLPLLLGALTEKKEGASGGRQGAGASGRFRGIENQMIGFQGLRQQELPPAASRPPEAVSLDVPPIVELPVEEQSPYPTMTAAVDQVDDTKPLSIEIHAPIDATCGDVVDITIKLAGNVTNTKWSIDPPVKTFRQRTEPGDAFSTWAELWSRDDASFLIKVTAVGTFHGKPDAVSDEVQVNWLRPVPPAPVAPPQNMQAQGMQSQPMPTARPTQKQWESIIARSVNDKVRSTNRVNEARSISGMFANLITRLETLNFDGSDYVSDVRQQAQLTFGAQTAGRWRQFFDELEKLKVGPEDLPSIMSALARLEPGG